MTMYTIVQPFSSKVKEYALKFCDHALMVSFYDKHHVEVGEPGLPAASMERGN